MKGHEMGTTRIMHAENKRKAYTILRGPPARKGTTWKTLASIR